MASRSAQREPGARVETPAASLSSPHALLFHIHTLGSFGLQSKLQGLRNTSGTPPPPCHLTWPCCPQGVQCPAPRQMHLESLLPGNPLPCSVPSPLGLAPGNCHLSRRHPGPRLEVWSSGVPQVLGCHSLASVTLPHPASCVPFQRQPPAGGRCLSRTGIVYCHCIFMSP